MSIPRVSVILAVYNGDRYLGEAIESVLLQTISDYEFLIINDGSTDWTRKIIEEFRDNRIVAFHRENSGLIRSLNFGISQAKSPLIARMDADDICLPDRLKIQVAELEKRPDVVALGGGAIIIDDAGRNTGRVCMAPEKHEDIIRGILDLTGDTFVHPTAVVRRDKLLAIGGYNDRFLASQDVDLWLRLGEVDRLCSMPEVVLKFRQHQDSVSRRRRREQLKFGMAARICYWLRQNGLNDPSVASDRTWREFITRISKELASRGVYDADAYRIELRNSDRLNSSWGKLWRMAWLCTQNPRRLSAIRSKQRYLRALDCFVGRRVSSISRSSGESGTISNS